MAIRVLRKLVGDKSTKNTEQITFAKNQRRYQIQESLSILFAKLYTRAAGTAFFKESGKNLPGMKKSYQKEKCENCATDGTR